MCGFSGFVDFSKNLREKILIDMTNSIIHRGPDGTGYFFEVSSIANMGLGHRRLSILDLSEKGKQPMEFDNLVIVYNGEVYNFKEIRKELEKYGYNFKSDSDTEVILKAYHKWGLNSVHKFIGMFAIAILDKKKEELILIRDRVGVKPLYWYMNENVFLFASELKAFHKNPFFKKELDIDSVALYFRYGYIPEPYSVFKNVFKVPAGHIIKLNLKSKTINKICYWNIANIYSSSSRDITLNEAIEELEKLFISSFKYRLVSDVPVGIFLSGGLDSSLVTAILQANISKRLKTFTIGFYEDKYDEAKYAKQVAAYLGTDHTEYYFSSKDAIDIIPNISIIYDEPLGDSSVLPTILLNKITRRYVKVSLSADGGDELFAGYIKYSTLSFFEKVMKIPFPYRKFLASILKKLPYGNIPFIKDMYNLDTRVHKFMNALSSKDTNDLIKNINQYFSDENIKLLFVKDTKELPTFFNLNIETRSLIEKALIVDMKTFLVDDILTKVDRASMSVGLEAREPLLDHRIIEFVAKLPIDFKVRKGEKKWVLKQILYKYIPPNLVDRPKMGFAPPLVNWLKSDLREYLDYYLDEKRLKKEDLGIFNLDYIIRLKKEYILGKNRDFQKLWLLLVFEMWKEKWL